MYKKKMIVMTLLPSITITVLYRYSYINNIRSILGDIIAFNAALFSFLIVFFTVMLGIQSSDLFRKIESYFANSKQNIFSQIKNLLLNSLILFPYCLLAKISNPNMSKDIKTIGVFILFVFLFWECSGIYYILNDMYDFVVSANSKTVQK
ncbi:MAG: hypothetical protein ACRDCE_06085 [Cetobacterium sp.]|uniref:hypothetical protein n=1 Tax=Cetobacterium sp. TaxID=2071632 RepID=UPI003EE5BF66